MSVRTMEGVFIIVIQAVLGLHLDAGLLRHLGETQRARRQHWTNNMYSGILIEHNPTLT